MYNTEHENGVLICSIHRTPISKSHGRFFCLKCQRSQDADAMAKNLIQRITDYEGAGFNLTESIARARKESCAGSAVWEKVLSEI